MRLNRTIMEVNYDEKRKLMAEGIEELSQGIAKILMSVKSDMENFDDGTNKIIQLIGTLLKPILETDREILSGDNEYIQLVLQDLNKNLIERMPDVVDILAMNQGNVLSLVGGLQ